MINKNRINASVYLDSWRFDEIDSSSIYLSASLKILADKVNINY